MQWKAALVMFAFAGSMSAQSDFVKHGSIGEVKKEEQSADSLETLELKDWVGQKFLLLPKTTKLQSFGYQEFDPRLPYGEWVGTILTVTEVTEGSFPKVTFKTDDGKVVRATMFGGNINGIAPLRDLEYAKTRWLGKTLWIRGKELVTWSEKTEEFGSVDLKKYSPVKVEDVIAGWYNHQPVRLLLKAPDGRIGFLDVSVSGTNVTEKLRGNSKFEDEFLEADPRQTHKWSKEVWSAIESEKVFVGMTAEQARMSWGEPESVNRTSTARGVREQWVYGSGNYLYVTGGKVTAIQN